MCSTFSRFSNNYCTYNYTYWCISNWHYPCYFLEDWTIKIPATTVRVLIRNFFRNKDRMVMINKENEFLSIWGRPIKKKLILPAFWLILFSWLVTVAPDMAAANFVHQYFHEGYIVFTEGNNTGKICVDSLNSSSLLSTARQQSFLEIFGESACRSMSYRIMERIEIRIDNERSADYAHLTEPIRWRATFLRAPCRKRQVLYLSCSGLGMTNPFYLQI